MKIVSLLPSATEIVCSLGLGGHLAAITHECDFPDSVKGLPAITSSRISHETMSSKEIDHAVRSHLDGHGSIYDLDTRLLGELEPDLILTQELCDVCAVSYETVQRDARIYAAEANVISLEPNTIGDIIENIRSVGRLTGAEDAATRVISSLTARLDAVRQKIADAATRPGVFMLEWLEPPFAPGHWVPEQVEIAGGKALLGQTGMPSVTTTYDAILESNPDCIVMIPCGYYIKDVIRQLESTTFPSNWRDISAIEKGEVWTTDATSYFSRPGPRVVDGVEILAKIFHPEIFGPPAGKEAIRLPKEMLRFA